MTLKHRLKDYILQENTISDVISQNFTTFNSMLIQFFVIVSEIY